MSDESEPLTGETDDPITCVNCGDTFSNLTYITPVTVRLRILPDLTEKPGDVPMCVWCARTHDSSSSSE